MIDFHTTGLSNKAMLVLRDVDRLIQAYGYANKKPDRIHLSSAAYVTLDQSLTDATDKKQSLTTHSYRGFPLVHYRD
jgi:hypothetical protein